MEIKITETHGETGWHSVYAEPGFAFTTRLTTCIILSETLYMEIGMDGFTTIKGTYELTLRRLTCVTILKPIEAAAKLQTAITKMETVRDFLTQLSHSNARTHGIGAIQ